MHEKLRLPVRMSQTEAAERDAGPRPSHTSALGRFEKAGSYLGEARASKWSLPIKIVFVASWFAIGNLVLCLGEGHHFVTSLYIQIQMLTTIGYGDVTVQTSDLTKFFLAVYSLVTLFGASTIMISLIEKLSDAAGSRMAAGLSEDEGPSPLARARTRLNVTGCQVAAALLAGTLFYSLAESCSCSYAESAVEGCDPGNCVETGGYTKTFLDAFYMSCISLTTIGFGDYAPKSMMGRLFGAVWMTVGVVLLASFQGALYSLVSEMSRSSSRIDLDALFDAVDRDKSGHLDRFEFLTLALLDYGLISVDDVAHVFMEFDKLDADRSGKLSKQEVEAKFRQVREATRRSSTRSVNASPKVPDTE